MSDRKCPTCRGAGNIDVNVDGVRRVVLCPACRQVEGLQDSPVLGQPTAVESCASRVTDLRSGTQILERIGNELVEPKPIRLYNSCPDCQGSQKCSHCSGAGRQTKVVDGVAKTEKCSDCAGSGKCRVCKEHVSGLSNLKKEIDAGYLCLAEATIQVMLQKVNEDEFKGKTTNKSMLIGGLATLGAVLVPGIGMVGGALAGNLLADHQNSKSEPHIQAKRADLFYALAVIYDRQERQAESKLAYIKALTMSENHKPTIEALRRMR